MAVLLPGRRPRRRICELTLLGRLGRGGVLSTAPVFRLHAPPCRVTPRGSPDGVMWPEPTLCPPGAATGGRFYAVLHLYPDI